MRRLKGWHIAIDKEQIEDHIYNYELAHRIIEANRLIDCLRDDGEITFIHGLLEWGISPSCGNYSSSALNNLLNECSFITPEAFTFLAEARRMNLNLDNPKQLRIALDRVLELHRPIVEKEKEMTRLSYIKQHKDEIEGMLKELESDTLNEDYKRALVKYLTTLQIPIPETSTEPAH